MKNNDIRVDLEIELESNLFQTLEGKLVEKIIAEANYEPEENIWKNILEGHSFKVTEKMSPKLYHIFHDVKNKLNYKKNIDFYITNSAELNAFALTRSDDKDTDIININSALISMFDDDELRFVVGHEIGHLITRYARVVRLINFIFPDPEKVPLILAHRIELWQKVSELTADRFGFIASPNVEKCVSGFFKMASGLSTDRIDFDYKAYLIDNEKILEYFTQNRNMFTHPVNPLRIKAIKLFSESSLYGDFKNDKEFNTDQVLNAEMDKLIAMLQTISTSPMDAFRKQFLASAGLIMANIDKNINDDEYESILESLSNYTVFPHEYLSEICNTSTEEVFKSSISNIIQQNPAERFQLLQYMANIAMSDNSIFNKEINFLFEVGESLLGLTRREIAQILAATLQQGFIPELYR
ncbi:MAG TPA: M48 family metallopeptidase [Paludibacteraceae bacterium]|nr:M48 family metallopeptidase [Paludibacteraceae bacterium]